MVGVVGDDFPHAHRALYERAAIDLQGLQTVEGKTFRWSGVYEENMDNRRTLSTELNVFESFSPELPEAFLESPFVFLANISPDLQIHVLEQVKNPRFVMADTMDLWIATTREDLDQMIERVDLLTVNESEARQLTGQHSPIRAARELLARGPEYVLIKKGEHGSILFYEDEIFLMPAFPLEHVNDPTGAGDMFAGAFMGALAADGGTTPDALRKAMLYGSVVASFGVEDFSLDRLAELSMTAIEERAGIFRRMLHC
jgi:sugar/nucleoside kinase (ribokinase family)